MQSSVCLCCLPVSLSANQPPDAPPCLSLCPPKPAAIQSSHPSTSPPSLCLSTPPPGPTHACLIWSLPLSVSLCVSGMRGICSRSSSWQVGRRPTMHCMGHGVRHPPPPHPSLHTLHILPFLLCRELHNRVGIHQHCTVSRSIQDGQ